MQGKLIAGISAVAACGVTACCLMPSFSSGADHRRGGNHGCEPSDVNGYMFSDHFFESGDNISFGYQFEPGSGPPPGNEDRENFFSRNAPTGGGTAASLSCGVDLDTIFTVK